jgi:hypothetical protein
MSRMLNKKTAAIVSVLFLIAAGGAYAYFTQSGTGDGTATTGSGTGITVNQTSTVSALTPGSTAQALSGTLSNSNPGRVHVVSVTATLLSIQGSPAGCSIADYQINDPTYTYPTPIDLANGTGGAWSGPTIVMLDRNQNQDGCKGATVNIHYTTSSV